MPWSLGEGEVCDFVFLEGRREPEELWVRLGHAAHLRVCRDSTDVTRKPCSAGPSRLQVPAVRLCGALLLPRAAVRSAHGRKCGRACGALQLLA
eukprot:7442838-Heterocapsa_arctica.AAC.1